MTEQKRPVLSLKRKNSDETPVRRKKTIINVTTPPKWKVKKQQLAEKAAREAERAEERAQAKKALAIYQKRQPLEDAISTLKPWWPGLFEDDSPRLLACGIREVLLAEIEEKNIPLSRKKIRRALKSITRSEGYLTSMIAGRARYNQQGQVAGEVTVEDERDAVVRLEKLRRQDKQKAKLRAVLEGNRKVPPCEEAKQQE